jgi:hypothetical protein
VTDQKRDGRAISLLAVIVIVLLALVSVLSAVAIVEYFHARRETVPPDAAEKGSKTERVSMELQYETAIHESGHAVIGQIYLPERPLKRVWLYTEKLADTDYLGMTEPGETTASYPEGAWDRAIALFYLGGQASELVFFDKKPPDAYEDKDVAGEETLDYCDKVGCECPPASKVGEQCLLRDLMQAERERLFVETVPCLKANKETVLILANQLFRKDAEDVGRAHLFDDVPKGKRRTLEADELKTFFATHPLAPCPAPDVPKP